MAKERNRFSPPTYGAAVSKAQADIIEALGLAGQRVGYVDENTTVFPTTKIGGEPLEDFDYVEVAPTANVPFTIEGIEFKTKLDRAVVQSGKWISSPSTKVLTREIEVYDKRKESPSGNAITQDEVNAEVVVSLKTLIVLSNDIDSIPKVDIENKIYYQYEDTTNRRKGYYWYNYLIDKWDPVGTGTPDAKSIILTSDGKLSIANYAAAADGFMPVKDSKTGIRWVKAVNTEELEAAVQLAEDAATRSGTYSAQAGNYAANALDSLTKMKEQFWYGDMEEYNEAVKQGIIKRDTIAFIKQETAVLPIGG